MSWGKVQWCSLLKCYFTLQLTSCVPFYHTIHSIKLQPVNKTQIWCYLLLFVLVLKEETFLKTVGVIWIMFFVTLQPSTLYFISSYAAKKTATVWRAGIFHIPQKDIFFSCFVTKMSTSYETHFCVCVKYAWMCVSLPRLPDAVQLRISWLLNV